MTAPTAILDCRSTGKTTLCLDHIRVISDKFSQTALLELEKKFKMEKMSGENVAEYPFQVREKLVDRVLLIIGTSNNGARLIWDIFANAKLKVILVGHKFNNEEKSKVHEVISYDYYSDPSDVDKHTNNIIQLLGERVKYIDGCFTFTEEDIIITAVICQRLGLTGFSPEAAENVRSKYKTYEVLRSKSTDTVNETERYSPLSYRIRSENDIKRATKIKYPAILKPEQDAGSWGVIKVNSEDECILHFTRIQNSFDTSRFGGNFGKTMVLMEFLDGLSYNVDLVIYNGELMTALIGDVGLYLSNRFIDTSTCHPTNLTSDAKDQVITAAHLCCCKIGLVNGVFNTEWKITESGPKLVEINGRIAAYRRSIVYKTTHGVILWEIAAAIACGIKPLFPNTSIKCFAVGAYLYTQYHGEHFFREGVYNKLKSLADANVILLEMYCDISDILNDFTEFPLSFCHIVALSRTGKSHARRVLIKLYRDLGFSLNEYDIEWFTSVWK
ncbi:carnosine synthase 1-like [Argopecten irradians]|uniref:carnosine synthase 1-like n=1 Tax=Argopecten irradians TaxID=31199 RepID=UPI003715F98D